MNRISNIEKEMQDYCLIGDYIKRNEQKKPQRQIKYPPLNSILYGNDNEIQETIRNLIMGKIIYKLLEQEELKKIKQRTINGKIASIDQKVIVDYLLQQLFNDKDNCEQFENIVNNQFFVVILGLSVGLGKNAFGELLNYNTNISAKSVFDAKKRNKFKKKLIKTLKQNYTI